ncbi:hypothetical protein FRC06_005296 [Ceratobasidium sp. 370]|nr:hypothetical protein FRC06_005296 [Ceratobasidium sp. 370]
MSEARARLHERMICQYEYQNRYFEERNLPDELPALGEDGDHDSEFDEILCLLQEPIDWDDPGAFLQRSANIADRLRNRSVRIAEEQYTRLARLRELGFRLEARDLPGAAMAMLSFVMEQGDDEDGDQDEDDDEYEGEHEGGEGHEGEEGREGGDVYQGDGAYRGDGAMGVEEDEEELARRRRQKPRKPRRPYSVTCALRKTNWFESSLEWEGMASWGRTSDTPNSSHLLAREPWCYTVAALFGQFASKVLKICGLDGIVGSLDGTLCGLETKPRANGDNYISRKQTLSVNVQAIVDHHGVFLAFQTGWAGSRPDVAVWPNMWVYLEQHRLFANGEYLLAHGGYPISPLVLIPYNRRDLRVDGDRRRRFNYRISRARIVVEWAFGRLKGRFPALKRLGAVRDMADIYRAIEAMMVVHNLCHEFSDAPDGFEAQSDDDDETSDHSNDPEDAGGDERGEEVARNHENLM